MLVAISTTQLIDGKTVVANADGTLTATRKLFGIVPDSLANSQAAKANRSTLATARMSGSISDLMAAQASTKRSFQNISVAADAVLTGREAEEYNGVQYLAVHGGSLYAEVDEAFVAHYSTYEARKAAQSAARKAGA